MTRMLWGDSGNRFFETGVDRGVLYLSDQDGVPWNGLTSVEESPTGGEARPYYQDGVKFLNISGREEFEATIEAFSSPTEFGVCDGTVSIQKGLFVTQQPRRAFGLSYRTMVGNDLDGVEHGYKIHLVYNALAAPSSRANSTMTNSPEATTLSWAITTLPPSFTGYKPTAHLVIDSRTTPKGLLSAIEDILYGSDAADPRMPLVSELISMFQSQGPLTRRNLHINPSFRTANNTNTLRTNMSTNPTAEAAVTGWGSGGGRMTMSTPTVATPPNGGTKVVRGTVNVDMGASSGYMTQVILNHVVGNEYTSSVYINSPVTRNFNLTTSWRDAANTVMGSASSSVVSCPAGVWTRLSVTSTCPTGADRQTFLIVCNEALVIGDYFDADALLVEFAGTALPYFDGNTPAAEGVTYSWTGSANTSTSVATGVDTITAPTKVYALTSGVVGWVSETGVYRILCKRAVASTALLMFSSTNSSLVAAVPGEIFSGRFKMRQVGGSANANVLPIIYAYTAATAVVQPPMAQSAASVTLPNDGTWQDVVAPSTTVAPATAATARWYIRNGTGGFPAGTVFEVKEFLMTKDLDVGLTPGSYFDGDTPDADNYFYAWEGAANASSSIENTWN